MHCSLSLVIGHWKDMRKSLVLNALELHFRIWYPPQVVGRWMQILTLGIDVSKVMGTTVVIIARRSCYEKDYFILEDNLPSTEKVDNQRPKKEMSWDVSSEGLIFIVMKWDQILHIQIVLQGLLLICKLPIIVINERIGHMFIT